MDGFLDAWDYLFRQNEVAYSYKISDNPLTSISISNGEGKFAAVGDSEGSVTMIQLCKSLYEDTGKEKEEMQAIFDREFKWEKNLEQAKNMASKVVPKGKDAKGTIDEAKKLQEQKQML